MYPHVKAFLIKINLEHSNPSKHDCISLLGTTKLRHAVHSVRTNEALLEGARTDRTGMRGTQL